MKKITIIATLTFMSLSLNASDFKECGHYSFKGVLREDKKEKASFAYVVNEKTMSQMNFSFSDKKEMVKLVPLLDQPTTFTGLIATKMDGTKGVIKEVSAIEKRFPDPLNPAKDTGISFLKSSKCE